MRYLFEVLVPVVVSISSVGDDDLDVALLSPSLWNTLFDLTESAAERAAIHITSQSLYSAVESSRLRRSFSCWCRLDKRVQSLVLPARLFKQYATTSNLPPHFPSAEWTCYVSAVCPTPLTKALLSVDRQDDLEHSQTSSTSIQKWLYDTLPFFHQGSRSVLSLKGLTPSRSPPSQLFISALEYRSILTDPVLHGVFHPSLTSLHITHHCSSRRLPETKILTTEEDSQDEIEINESFLGGLTFLPAPPTQSVQLVRDGCLNQCDNWGCTYPLLPLYSPMCSQHEDPIVCVRTKDLSRIGILNGEWIVLQLPRSKSRRLMRVIVDDSLDDSPAIFTSPIQLHNMHEGRSPPYESSTLEVILQPSPFGVLKPAVPTAQSVTISRIASPLSVDKTFEQACLEGLRRYLQVRSRLLKKGDMIAVAIDTDYKQEPDESEVELEINTEPTCPNGVVFFIVTNMEHEILPPIDVAISSDIYVESTTGELGCWVDPTCTRVIQAGIEHSRIPSCVAFFGLVDADYGAALKPCGVLLELIDLSSAALSRNASEYCLQLSVLLQGPRGIGKTTTALNVANHLGLHFLELDCYGLIGDNPTQTEAFLRARFEKAASCSPCVFLLKHIDALSQTSQPNEQKNSLLVDSLTECMGSLAQTWAISGFPVLVFATATSQENLPTSITSSFKHQVIFQPPDEQARTEFLNSVLSGTALTPGVDISELACETAAFTASDLSSLQKVAARYSVSRAFRTLGDGDYDLHRAIVQLSKPDIDSALAHSRASHAESIGTPQIPNVTWDDVGGIAHAKAEILDTIQLPLDHPELFADGLKKRSGILLYGPPGTGKTLLAKAVATSFALNFFSVKGPELLNMYIGESEANVRRVFQRAKDARPCVIFFDELDSIAPKRGYHGDSGGVMDRIVSQLLAELDGVSSGASGSDVFVIGATNRPDLLDPALLRPGRFDRLLYLGVSDTKEGQLNILRALTRKFKLHPDFHLEDVVESCPFHFTGADFYALSSDALMRAMSRKAEEIDRKIAELNSQPATDQEHPYPLTPQYFLSEIAQASDIEVVVSHEDFESALQTLVPSVSAAEMEHYRSVQKQFSRQDEDTE